MSGLDAWLAGGSRVPVGAHHLFQRVDGTRGPWLTFFHGFPTSSYDQAGVVPVLAAARRVLSFDFLGFGDSDKPAGHDYRLVEQADFAEALWQRHGIEETGLVAHDYGVSVAQEILARALEGKLRTRLTTVLFLNGGVFPDLHRPRPVQKLLLWPVIGALVGRTLTESAFRRSFKEIFAPGRVPPDAELHEHWRALRRHEGRGVYHRLIQYIPERRIHGARWTHALAASPLPLRFLWGMRDPVSGAHMAAAIRARVPRAALLAELADVGHYPQLEDPQSFLAAAEEAFPA